MTNNFALFSLFQGSQISHFQTYGIRKFNEEISNHSCEFKDILALLCDFTDYGHTIPNSLRPKFQFQSQSQSQSQINTYLGFGYKGLVFCRNNG